MPSAVFEDLAGGRHRHKLTSWSANRVLRYRLGPPRRRLVQDVGEGGGPGARGLG